MSKWLGALCLIASILSLATVCHANGGPDVSIHSLIQDGQDVEILVGIIHDPTFTFSITRSPADNEEESIVIFENMSLAEEDADDIVPYCDSVVPPQSVCLVDPDECVDCDGDGEIDCYSDMCFQRYFFVLVDDCVWPGDYRYTAICNAGSRSETIGVSSSGDCCGCNVGSGHGKPSGLITLVFSIIGIGT